MALSPLRSKEDDDPTFIHNIISPDGLSGNLSPSIFQSPATLTFTSPYRTPFKEANETVLEGISESSSDSNGFLTPSNPKTWTKSSKIKVRGKSSKQRERTLVEGRPPPLVEAQSETTDAAPTIETVVPKTPSPSSPEYTPTTPVSPDFTPTTPDPSPSIRKTEPGFLMIRNIRVKNIPFSNVPREPFCVVTLGDQTASTRTAKPNNPHPIWDDLFNFLVENNQTQMVKVTVMAKELVGTDVFIAETEFPLYTLAHFRTQDFERDLPGTDEARLQLKMRFITLTRTKTTEHLFLDRFGFTVQCTHEQYEEALSKESTYAPQPPSLITGTSRIARQGIGYPYKARYWQIFAMKHLDLKTSPFTSGLYEQLSLEEGNKVLLGQIDKDLPRTFPNHPSFHGREGRQALGRILKAFSLKHPNIGYTQAMNFIAGYLLLLMEEELAFKMLTVLVEHIVPGYYSNTMGGLQADQAVLNHLVKEKLPKLWNFLKDIKVDLNVMTTKWFMCLFIHTLPFPSVLRVWDILFCKGSASLIIAALALLKVKENEILSRSDFGNSTEFPDVMCRNYYNWEEMVDIMYTIVSFSHVEKLQKEAREKIDRRIRVRQIRDCENTNFTEDELYELLRKFEMVATNETISCDQFLDFFDERYQQFVSYPVFTERIFAKFDRNSDGVLDFRELCHSLSLLDRGTPDQKIRFCFGIFGTEKDFISRNDLSRMLTWQYDCMDFNDLEEMVQTSVDFAFAEFDEDKDGKLSYEEFSRVVYKQPFIVEMLRLVE